jgi:hypothetical protein
MCTAIVENCSRFLADRPLLMADTLLKEGRYFDATVVLRRVVLDNMQRRKDIESSRDWKLLTASVASNVRKCVSVVISLRTLWRCLPLPMRVDSPK